MASPITAASDVEAQMRRIQFAVKHAADEAIADCPDVDEVHIDIKARLRPQNYPVVTIKVENKD